MTDIAPMMQRSPLPDMVASMGKAIAEAQTEMDRSAAAFLKELADPENGVTLPGETKPTSLLKMGFAPSFYHFSETRIEAKIAFSTMTGHEATVGLKIGVPIKFVTIGIDASYTNKYSFEAEGSSTVSTKIVSVPPPAPLGQLIARESKPNE